MLQYITNKSDWTQDILFTDVETGEPMAGIEEATVAEIELRDTTGNVVLTGTLEDGTITLPGDGVLTWTFPIDRVGVLEPGAHEVWISLTLSDIKTDIFVDNVQVFVGV